MARMPQAGLLKTVAGPALLFAVIAYSYDLRTATAFIGSCIAGWLNVFGIFHAVLAAAKRLPVSGATLFVILVALLCDALIVLSGYALVLALVTGCLLLIDALVLRFSGEPIGHRFRASEP